MDPTPRPDGPSNTKKPEEAAPTLTLAPTRGEDELLIDSTADAISYRLFCLARLALETEKIDTAPSSLDTRTVLRCLDTLEFLINPRPNLSREISSLRQSQSQKRTRSKSETKPGPDPEPTLKAGSDDDTPRAASPVPDSSHHEDDTPSFSQFLDAIAPDPPAPIPSTLPGMHDKVKVFEEEVRKLAEAFMQRRDEAYNLYSLYSEEKGQLGTRIEELKAEIEGMQMDMDDNITGLEALEGIVRGLETWIDSWLEEYRSKKIARQEAREWWTLIKVDKTGDRDVYALVDGVQAWMRGWKDAAEELRNQVIARRLERENKRQIQDTEGTGSSADDQS